MPARKKLEIHEHSYITGRNANIVGRKLVHSHAGGDRGHAHEHTGPAAYTIDRDAWYLATGLRGGGRKKFTANPSGPQLAVHGQASATMMRDEMISKISILARERLVEGCYVDTDAGELCADGPDFCREHADQVARVHAIAIGDAAWVSSTSMGSDGHRECAFIGCGKHLDFGGLTDYGIKSALGLTEETPREVSCYPSELELVARALGASDPRWELWEHHARATIAWEMRRQ